MATSTLKHNTGETKTTASQSGINLANASAGAYCDTVLEAGTWVILRGCNFSTSGSGYRWVGRDATDARMNRTTASAISGAEMFLQHLEIAVLSESTTVKTWVYQNSGSGLTIYPYLHAIKIA